MSAPTIRGVKKYSLDNNEVTATKTPVEILCLFFASLETAPIKAIKENVVAHIVNKTYNPDDKIAGIKHNKIAQPTTGIKNNIASIKIPTAKTAAPSDHSTSKKIDKPSAIQRVTFDAVFIKIPPSILRLYYTKLFHNCQLKNALC